MLNEINLSKFLSRYCNLTGKNLSKINHEAVKFLFSYLKRATFEEIRENPMLVATGEVLLVNDGKKVIPYYVPDIEYEELDEPQEVSMQRVDNTPKVDYGRHDYTKMSIYELKCLLKRKFNSYANQRNARIELESRGVVLSKKYNRCEEKRKIEREKNERY